MLLSKKLPLRTYGVSPFSLSALESRILASGSPAPALVLSMPGSEVPNLASRPSSTAKLYLDFNGDFTTNWGGHQPGSTPAYDTNGDPTTFSTSELAAINEIWARVSEKYASFDLDVTTIDPGTYNDRQALHVVIGGNGAWTGSGALGGIAEEQGFYDGHSNTVFIFEDNLARVSSVAEACCHESGHAFGLSHQSSYDLNGIKTAEYNSGDARSAPVMGNSYSAQRGLWWYGTSVWNNIYQDDLSVLSNSATNGFGYRPDDHGNSIGSADAFSLSGTTLSGSGVIETTADTDSFSFSTSGGAVSFTAAVGSYVLAQTGSSAGGTLDLRLELRDAAGNLITSADTASLGETVTANLAAGTYYLIVASHGGYGDVGTYSITGTAPQAGAGPVANIGGAYSAAEGGSVNLSAAASTGSGLTYLWDLDGDGIFGETGAGATHGNETGVSPTFLATGLDGPSTYAIALQITDSNGLTSSASTNISITNAIPVVTPSGSGSVNEGSTYTLNFSAADAGGDSLSSWSINWGDGSAVTTVAGDVSSATHVFADNHAYTVTFSATDKDGGIGSATKSVTVVNVAPVAFIFGAPSSSPEGTAVNLTSSIVDPGTADTFTYLWGVTKNGVAYKSGTASTFTFTPNDNGTYIVTLTVTDKDGATASDSETVIATNVAPTAAISTTPASSPEGTLISMTGSAIDPGTVDTLTYAWGVTKDGVAYATGTGTGYSFTPNDNATYLVTLTVTDKDGATGTASKTITGTNALPIASITGAPASSPEGTAINLTGSATDAGALDTTITDAWSVTKNGAGYATGTGTSFVFTPNDNGTYLVTLTATDKDGGAGTTTRTITASNVAPTATITGAPTSSPEGTAIPLTGSATDPGALDTLTYSWSATKGGVAYTTGTGASFSLTPNDNATYVVTLTVTDKDGSIGTTNKTITVTNVAPTVAVTGAPSESPEGTAVNLASSAVDPGALDTFTYAWAVTKNGVAYKSGVASTFTFTPNDNGTFVVTLTVTDKDGSATTAASKTVVVSNANPTAAIGATPETSPEGTAISVTGSATDPGTLDTLTYAWSVTKDEVPYASGTGTSLSFTPNDNANYIVTLTATDKDGGVGITSRSITVTNVAPTLHLSGATQVKNGTPYILGLTSADPGTDTLSGWTVNWGDGQIQSIEGNPASASHTYTVDGDFMIAATGTDEDGTFAAANALVFGVSDVADVVAPTAALGSTVTVAAGATSGTFTVTYTDDVAINQSLLADGNVQITGPNGFSQLAHFASSVAGASAGQRVATYSFTPPGGKWSYTGNGSYTIQLLNNQVADTGGNYAPAKTLGGFSAKLAIPDLGGTSLTDAAYAGIVSTGYNSSFSDFLSKGDRNDYYRLRIKATTQVDVKMQGMSDNVDMQFLDGNGRVLQTSARAGIRSEAMTRLLAPGTYYIRTYYSGLGSTPYTLKISSGVAAAPGATPTSLGTDTVGNKTSSALNIGTVVPGSSQIRAEALQGADTSDVYSFRLAKAGSLNASLYGLADDAQLQLLDGSGRVIQTSSNAGLSDEAVAQKLTAGNYFLRVFSDKAIRTNYTLAVAAA
ncbi:MAG: hypothetical protein JWN40_5018 [Phycisphaerales bacterium]|nr:hypothetical protein [Phycisphaerales bacterium]